MAFPRNGSNSAQIPVSSVTFLQNAVGTGATAAGTGAVLSGALTADTYKTILSITKPGVLRLAGVVAVDATARTVTIKVEVDGKTIATSAYATSAGAQAAWAVGYWYNSAGSTPTFIDEIPFNTLRISVKSSLSETDKLNLNYAVNLYE